jgi:hypothetical protein
VKALDSWTKPFSLTTMFFLVSNLLKLIKKNWKKLEKNANGRKNCKQQKVAKILKSKLKEKIVTLNE